MAANKPKVRFFAFAIGAVVLIVGFSNCNEYRSLQNLGLSANDQTSEPPPVQDPLPVPQPPAFTKALLYLAMPDVNTIDTFAINLENGKLTKLGSVVIPGEVVPLRIHTNKKFLYAGLRTNNSVASFAISQQTGLLTFVKEVSIGLNPVFILLDFLGKNLLMASTNNNAVTVLPLGADGGLSDMVSDTKVSGPTSHSVISSQSGKYIYAANTVGNTMSQFLFDSSTGKLTAHSTPKVQAPEGAGPRHTVHHPTKDIIYAVNENGDSVTVYQVDKMTGQLTVGQTVSTIPATFDPANNTCADIHITNDAKFLYASNRGHESLAIFAIDSQGQLSPIGHQPVSGTPREFEIDPGSKFIYVAGLYQNKLSTFVIGPTGLLTLVEILPTPGSPMWVYSLGLP